MIRAGRYCNQHALFAYRRDGQPFDGARPALVTVEIDHADVFRLHEAFANHRRAAEDFVLADAIGDVPIVRGGKAFVVNTATDLDYGRDRGVELVTYEDCRSGDGAMRVEAFLERLGDDEAYLTFDIDAVDPAYAPGTGTPVCGGFSSAQAIASS